MASETGFKLRCCIFGHEKDVRAVYPGFFPECAIISGSRDVTGRVWVPNEDELGYREGHVMSGHGNFVSCVCMLPPNDAYPTGLIFSGSHDKTIKAYTLDSPQPVFTLEGHTDTVCALAAGKFGTLLSGSWDKTARVWLRQKCVMTLQGHSAAVWAVALMPEKGLMLTGSADKTVKMWRAGKCDLTFKGHEDCVRDLAILNASEFLSCANDATIRRWLITGECTQTYYGHSNYVYSLAVLPNGLDFISGGEDRTLRVWTNGELSQTLVHPTQSVWSVCCLPNGDIVTGASDGVIRVFSSKAERQAPADVQKMFEDEVAKSTIPTQVGDIKKEDLPGPERLFNPGSKDGQTVMIRDDDKVAAYQWSAVDKKWQKIGDVVGSTGGGQASSGKQLYEGKEYDYVFSVEIEEGKPPLKLPFNATEDPWMAAHKFLQKNDLSPLFLDQVANFILEQVKGVTLGQSAPSGADPFTGGGSYVPGSGSRTAVENGTGVADPFTGAGRYVPGQPVASTGQAHGDPFTSSGSYQPAGSNTKTNKFFPQTTFLSFDSANPAAIIAKVKEFNSRVDSSLKVDEASITLLEDLMKGVQPTAQHLTLLWNLLQWPKDIVFPVLDVLRVSIKVPSVCQHFCNEKDGAAFLNHILTNFSPDSTPANQMLVMRTLCNAFGNPNGERLLVNNRDRILSLLTSCQTELNKNIQIASSSLLLNYAVHLFKNSDTEAKAQCVSVLSVLAGKHSDPEANFRLLVCLGTLIVDDDNSMAMAASLDVLKFVKKCQSIVEPQKVGECAGYVRQLLQ